MIAFYQEVTRQFAPDVCESESEKTFARLSAAHSHSRQHDTPDNVFQHFFVVQKAQTFPPTFPQKHAECYSPEVRTNVWSTTFAQGFTKTTPFAPAQRFHKHFSPTSALTLPLELLRPCFISQKLSVTDLASTSSSSKSL